jgi:acetyl esterase/lipase
MEYLLSQGHRLPLWPGEVPSAVGCEEADNPFVSAYVPRSSGPALASVVICPGGGYSHLAFDYEGTDCAEWLNSLGIAAFVLNYRVAPGYHHPAPLMDVQRAIRLVRSRSDEWNLDPAAIGVWGFSAGGHLASTVATHFDPGDASSPDPVNRASCRPDFAILCYPVVTMTPPYAHEGSRLNLIGEDPSDSLVQSLSNETQVTPDTPPTFLFHTDADGGVPPENSVMFYLAMRKAVVPCELHIFAEGPHGVGLAQSDRVLSKWPELLSNWLAAKGKTRRHAGGEEEQG